MNYSLFSDGAMSRPIQPQEAQRDEWITDPARLSFPEYMDRCLWGRPDSKGSRECIDRKLRCDSFWYEVSVKDNEYRNGEDPCFGTWERALESGRSYLVETARLRKSSSGGIPPLSPAGNGLRMRGVTPTPRSASF